MRRNSVSVVESRTGALQLALMAHRLSPQARADLDGSPTTSLLKAAVSKLLIASSNPCSDFCC